MTNYISTWISGGIGNQLFQIANCIEYKNKYNKEMVFKNEDILWHPFNHKRNTLWKTLLNNNIKTVDEDEYNIIKFNNYEEKEFTYNEIPFIDGNVNFRGYFQSYKYLSSNTINELNDLIYSNKDLVNKAFVIYNNIKTYLHDMNDDNYMFLHIRRTDYINNPIHNILSLDYYDHGVNILNIEKKKLIFSDDISWCKKNLKFDHMYFMDINDDIIEFLIMTFIKNGVIANSTFSWWASVLGTSKKIVAPRQWFQNNANISNRDIYLDNWIII